MQMFTSPSLTRRIVLSVMLGLGLILTIFGLVASWTVSEMAQATYRERLMLAQTVAGHVDDILRYSMGELTRTAGSLTLDSTGQFSDDQKQMLRLAQDQLGAFTTVSVANNVGVALWVDPPNPHLGASLLNHPSVVMVLQTGAPNISELPTSPNGEGPQACLGAPILDRAGRVNGVLMAEVDPRHAALSLLPTTAVEQGARIALIDSSGLYVAVEQSGERRQYDEHQGLLSTFIESAQAGVVIHRAKGGDPGHLVAYVPVASLPAWGVVVEQPGDIALAALRDLQRHLILAGVVALLAAIAFALLDARRLTRPLKELAAVAERFAAGKLDEEVRIRRKDEVGVLAHAFETMRLQLKRSLSQIEADNRELEARVHVRTREVDERNRQLATTNAIAATVSSSLKTDEILARAMGQVLDVTGLEYGRFMLLDAAANGSQQSLPATITQPPGVRPCREDCLCGRAIRAVAPVVARDVRAEPKATNCHDAGLTSVVAVPLCAQKYVLGVLFLGSTTEFSFDQRDLDTLSAIGQQIGMALANARLYEEVEERERARVRLLEQIMTAQEDERKRIARDLHDSTGQSLSAIVMGLEFMEEIDPADSDRLPQRMTRIKELASNAIAELRELVFDLRPIALDELGLVPALRAYADRHLGERGVSVSFDMVGMKGRLPSRLETTLFRVLQETIHNVAKHARARSVRIRLTRANGDFAADVEDDGVGFEPATVDQPTHSGEGLGLLGIKERVEMLGGSVRVDSSPGAGTRIHIALSLSKLEGGTP